MKKTFFILLLLAGVFILIYSCKKKDDNSSSTSGTYNLTVNVDMGGTFPVTGTCALNISGSTFTAHVKTLLIAGLPETHEFDINGTMVGDTGIVSNSIIVLTYPTDETDTLRGRFGVKNNTLGGYGTVVSKMSGGIVEHGTFTVSGTK